MPTLTTGEPQMSDRQQSYIEMLLSRRWVPSAVAGRIIDMLKDLPEANDDGLSDLGSKLERPNT